MTDQQRRDSIGAYGNPFVKTPNLDRLAEGGVRFNRCYIATSPCSPSRASLLTGLYAHTHGIVVNGIVLPESVPSLGNTLKAAGYRTAWVGKWHLGPTDSPKHGFTDKWVNHGKDYRDYLERVGLQTFTEGARGKVLPRGVRYGHSDIPEEHCLETFLAREAVAFLEEAGSQPFCLALSFRAPHTPVAPPEPWDKMYSRERVSLPVNLHEDMRNKPLRQRRLRTGRQDSSSHAARRWEGVTFPKSRVLAEWTEEEWREIIALYCGLISYVDKWTGRVLDTLDSLGLAENTIVLFTTDHGDMMGNHGLIHKDGYTYDETMRVPLIIRYPPLIRPGTATDALVSNVDILPTLLEMMGVKVSHGVQGRSFLPVLEGEAQSHRDATFMEIARGIKAVRTERWKYTANWRPRDLDELYDMKDDPLELQNLATDPENAKVCNELRKRILSWMGETKDPELGEFREATKQPPRRP